MAIFAELRNELTLYTTTNIWKYDNKESFTWMQLNKEYIDRKTDTELWIDNPYLS